MKNCLALFAVLTVAAQLLAFPASAGEEQDEPVWSRPTSQLHRTAISAALRNSNHTQQRPPGYEATASQLRGALHTLIDEASDSDELFWMLHGLQEARQDYLRSEQFDFRLLGTFPTSPASSDVEADTAGEDPTQSSDRSKPTSVTSAFGVPTGMMISVMCNGAAYMLMDMQDRYELACTHEEGDTVLASNNYCTDLAINIGLGMTWFEVGPGTACGY